MSESFPVVILGAGLTGLSTAFHLRGAPSVVLEREAEVGGLCRTRVEEGFTFDCTGHLLHLRDDRIRALVDAVLPSAFTRHERRALIHSQGVFTAYPFQANLHGLPPAVVKECVQGFVEALLARERDGDPDPQSLTFRQWAVHTFGEGIARHFMLPYNTKLWRTDLDAIECGWVSWSIPRPTLREVLEGAAGETVRGLGYNPTFLYPARGGISVVPEALAARCPDVRLRQTVVAVDAARRVVTLEGGRTIGYDALVSTLPLDRLLAMTRGLPADLPEAGGRLRAVRVVNINLGVDRPGVSGAHWIYFPEPEFPFYRAGFPSNLGAHLAPRGCSSISVERSLLRDEPFDAGAAIEEAIEGLRRARLLWRGDHVVHRRLVVLDPAYVIHDRFRAGALPRVLAALAEAGIHSCGRFGAWEYSSMEDALRAGMDLAARLGPALRAPRAAHGAAAAASGVS